MIMLNWRHFHFSHFFRFPGLVKLVKYPCSDNVPRRYVNYVINSNIDFHSSLLHIWSILWIAVIILHVHMMTNESHHNCSFHCTSAHRGACRGSGSVVTERVTNRMWSVVQGNPHKPQVEKNKWGMKHVGCDTEQNKGGSYLKFHFNWFLNVSLNRLFLHLCSC